MSRPWFRMYAEFAADPKVQLLAFDDQRHFIVLLCLKCNGTLDSATPSKEFRERMIAKALGVDSVTGNEIRRRLLEVGLVDEDWQPIKWDSRQYDHDLSTDRVRRFRERNGNETFPKRSETVSGTDESRTEQNRERVAKRSRRAPPDFRPDLNFAESQVPDIDASAEAAKFRDWEFKTPRSDWAAVWRTWVRNCKETGRYSRKDGGVKWQ